MRVTLFVLLLLAAVGLVPSQLEAQEAEVRYYKRASWTTDRRDFVVGDIITIVVDESTQAAGRAQKSDESGRSSGGSLSADIPASLFSSPFDALGFGTSVERSSRETENVQRHGRLSTVVSVRIAEIDDAGILKVQGEREIEVDGAKQKIVFTGYVRPEDVHANNSVSSNRVANATISYEGRDALVRPGFISRLLGWLWP